MSIAGKAFACMPMFAPAFSHISMCAGNGFSSRQL